MAEFKGSACIVGAGGGIGIALTRHLKANGASGLALLDLASPALDALARETGGHAVTLDARDPASVIAAIAAARAKLPRIDALVVCTGIVDTKPLDKLDLARWQEIIAINLTTPYLCCREGATGSPTRAASS
jgi:NAD(P)-dependent dehydrogenase (short-subunit alcohol dehydrogenase family)